MLSSRLNPSLYPCIQGLSEIQRYVTCDSDVDLSKIDPVFLGRVAALARDEGKVAHINSGWRDYAAQRDEYEKSGGRLVDGRWVGGSGRAAVPGTSMHEIALAIDTSSAWLKALEKRNATQRQEKLTKYGIFKPWTSGNQTPLIEDWHIQPVETIGKNRRQAESLAPNGVLFGESSSSEARNQATDVQNAKIEKIARLYAQPKSVLRDFFSKKQKPTVVDVQQVDIDAFRQPTDLEMIHGMKMVEETQELIRYDLTKTNHKDVMETLKKYAAFRFRSKNSMLDTMSLTVIGMPWLKPGYNLWVDPSGVDEVYYIHSVSHIIQPGSCVSTVNLVMGRPAEVFFGLSKRPGFGSLGTGGTYGSSIFITKDNAISNFNSTASIASYSKTDNYKSIIGKAIRFKSNVDVNYDLRSDAFMKELYGQPRKKATQNLKNVAGLNLEAPMSPAEIDEVISGLFKNAPSIVQNRAYKTSELFSELTAGYTV